MQLATYQPRLIYHGGDTDGATHRAAKLPPFHHTTRQPTSRTEISGMENTALYYSTYRSKLEPFWGDCHEIPPGDSCWVTCMMPAGCSLLLRPLTRCPPRAFQLSLPPIGSGPKPAQHNGHLEVKAPVPPVSTTTTNSFVPSESKAPPPPASAGHGRKRGGRCHCPVARGYVAEAAGSLGWRPRQRLLGC
jgi:hypothetical protein